MNYNDKIDDLNGMAKKDRLNKKNNKVKLILLIVWSLVLLIFLPSCGKNDKIIYNKPAVKIGNYKGTLTLSIYENVNSFNPYNCFNSTEKYISTLLYDSLVYYDYKTERFYYWIAKDIKKIDNNSLMITIKKGMKSSTGNIIDSDYVLSTFLLLKNISAALQDVKLDYLKAYKFEKVDLYSFKIINQKNDNDDLRKTNLSYFIDILQLPILPISVVKKIIHNEDYFYKFGSIHEFDKKKFVDEEFTGPWILQKVSEDRITLVRNPDYNFFDRRGRRLPYFEKVVLKKNNNLTQEFRQFLKKQIDAIILSEKDFKNLKKYVFGTKIKKIYNNSRYSILLLNLNSSSPELNKLFRDSISRLILYKLMDIKNIYNNNSNYILPFNNKNYKKTIIKKLKKISRNKIEQFKTSMKSDYSLYVYSKDKSLIEISKNIVKNLNSNGLNFKYIPLDLTTMVAKVYADNSWNFLLLNFSGNLKQHSLYNLLNPYSRSHILNLGNQKSEEEIELFNKVKKIYEIDFLFNPEYYLDNLAKNIFENMIFFPIGTEFFYIIYNRSLQNFDPGFIDDYIDYANFKLIYTFCND